MADESQLWATAWQAIESGRPDDAERLGRQVLQIKPQSSAWPFLLGAACHAQGRLAEAVGWYEQALRLRPNFPEAHDSLGNVLLDQGRPAEAAESFRRALALRPDLPETLVNLGIALRSLGRPSDAAECYEQALKRRPDYPEAHNNLGNALRDLREFKKAAESYRQALRLRTDNPAAYNNLGNALRDQGQSKEAEACFRQALHLRPDYAEAHNNLGGTLQDLERPSEAEVSLRRALELRPDFPEALINLGNALRALGRPTEAELCFRRALTLRPDSPEAHNNLGSVLRSLGRSAEAAESYRHVIRLRPDLAEAHNNLGTALRDLGRPSEAEACFRQAMNLRTDLAEAHNNLGTALRDQGRVVEAEACFRQALEVRSNFTAAHDALLMTLHYRDGVRPEQLAAEHADFDRRHAAPLRTHWRPHINSRDPERPPRLGFVSPDFGGHPVGFLLIQAVEALARRPCVMLCYSDRVIPPDDLSVRFRAAAAVWRDTAGWDDERLAKEVRADGVDVLIDLAGHTGGNRLLAFARRPAPVQATWLGYEGTTGLEAMDYLVADDRLVPPEAEAFCRERVLRLPGGYACYDPPAVAPEPGPLPALASGRVTFGCFNNPAKLSPPALTAFAAVLNRVPGSRLVLRYAGLDDPTTAGRLRGPFAAAGLDPGRVELHGRVNRAAYLAAFRDIDIALDPFPFGGGVTTCDALWMGVPLVTLPGSTFASRHGLGYAFSLGLVDELVARDVEHYVGRTAALTHDLGRLADLRASLRGRMTRSPLCDGERLADELLTALRGAWREWASSTEV
jgi:predicted O-linked N-acetylglucosamine transferase (SPINDLY family)